MSAFNCGSNITKCVEERNALQLAFINGSRLGIPASFVNEGLHGKKAPHARMRRGLTACAVGLPENSSFPRCRCLSA